MPSTTRRTVAAATVPTSLDDYRARARSADDHLDASTLERYYAARSRDEGRSSDFRRIVADVLSRADRVVATEAREWERFVLLVGRHRDNPKALLNCGVLANLIGVAAFGDLSDFESLDELGERFGIERIAAVQHRAARFIEIDPTYPVTTAALRRMAISAHVAPAVALLLEGIDPDEYLPVLRTPAELRGLVDGGSVLEWRHHLAIIQASPWSPYPRHLAELAEQSGRPQAATVVARFTETCQEHHKEREREQVADEVRRLVSESGVNQRQFAQWVGTSPSRLSTYVSGSVTPSASLMLRMSRTSRLLQERDVTHAPSMLSEPSWGAARAAVDVGETGSAAGPSERASGSLGRDRSHLSAV